MLGGQRKRERPLLTSVRYSRSGSLVVTGVRRRSPRRALKRIGAFLLHCARSRLTRPKRDEAE